MTKMSTPRITAPLKLATLAVATVIGLTILRYVSLPTNDYGYARDCFLRNVITFGSCGFGALLCIFAGIFLLRSVKTCHLHPLLATLIFIPVAIGAAFLPVPLIPMIDQFSEHTLFSGDNGFAVVAAVFFMSWFSGGAILVFLMAVCLLWFSRRERTHKAETCRRTEQKNGCFEAHRPNDE